MKKLFLITFAILSTCAFTQQSPQQPEKLIKDNKVVRKIKFSHADPMLIAIILSGKSTFVTQPENSTVIKK